MNNIKKMRDKVKKNYKKVVKFAIFSVKKKFLFFIILNSVIHQISTKRRRKKIN